MINFYLSLYAICISNIYCSLCDPRREQATMRTHWVSRLLPVDKIHVPVILIAGSRWSAGTSKAQALGPTNDVISRGNVCTKFATEYLYQVPVGGRILMIGPAVSVPGTSYPICTRCINCQRPTIYQVPSYYWAPYTIICLDYNDRRSTYIGPILGASWN